jgi:quinol monooxygenase YgiN
MFGLVVRFHCRDEAAAAGFDELVARTVPQIRELEPDTLVYASHTVDGAPAERVFYEIYRDRVAFDFHESQEHVKVFLAERGQYLSGYDVDFVTPTIAKGLDRG